MVLLFALMMQVQVRVAVPVPVVRFEAAPSTVEVQPGVMVVQDYEEEVFVVDGRYWMRARDGRWYRARDHRGGWVVAEPRMVPARLVRVPPGHYRHYHAKGRGEAKQEKFRMVNADGSVTEIRTKQKHGVTETKVKVKGRGNGNRHGKWK